MGPIVGRPTKFTQQLADDICERIALGETLADICADAHMPDRSNVWRWQKADETFRIAYALAREAQMEAWADDLLKISDDGRNDWMERHGEDNPGWALNGEHTTRSRLRLDTRRFLMAKIAPHRFGERLALTGAAGGPVEVAAEVTIVERVIRRPKDRDGGDI